MYECDVRSVRTAMFRLRALFPTRLFSWLQYIVKSMYTVCYGLLLEFPVRNECKETLALVILSTLLKLIM